MGETITLSSGTYVWGRDKFGFVFVDSCVHDHQAYGPDEERNECHADAADEISEVLENTPIL